MVNIGSVPVPLDISGDIQGESGALIALFTHFRFDTEFSASSDEPIAV
jgi:hypothetical protein